MFRSILGLRNPLALPSLVSYCTRPAIQRKPNFRAEVNDVKVVGTLISDSFTLASGTKSLTIRTRVSENRYDNHNVHSNTTGSFVTGQRVYIVGKLKSAKMQKDDKTITSTVVKASQIFVLENESASVAKETEGDLNQVELLANISSEVLVRDDHCSFAIATHFTKHQQQTDTADDIGTSFHRVFVYDKLLCQYIQSKLQKKDRILLNGRLSHMTHTLADGKKLRSGFIVANSLYRIARRTETQAGTNENAKVDTMSLG